MGNGAGAAAVGLNAGGNVVSSETRAYVADKLTVNARVVIGLRVKNYSGMLDASKNEVLPGVPAAVAVAWMSIETARTMVR